ncbi:MAG: FAD-dependent oxidoreductase, partial [Gammaproteobacteria bacterium]|nr:FAD-dependent oxidoreductase [Gammaproteobacteria bacterium]NIP90344.1 FAD-dependent oxidoreductase [Gammaproteobacteria bacterium]NIR22271.1 FAD-dependent oxidoreductase [Gammaproteobacteria bacterium]NIS03909.1 FAD-dependent oxidoreductase [Gammaproteobacteria bacterium]NIU42352.1 FAD-dependent oxidoreductase [Gammaproteobacteria bacterium]
GSGLAGYTTARELRKIDKETPLEMITADDGYFYSKPMISNALGRNQQPMDLPTADAAKMAADLGARVRPRTRVDAIDRDAGELHLDGETLAYGQLVLALGADPVRLALAGDADAPLSVNDLDDYARFRAAIADRRRIVILGAGLIGCEFANDLVTAGYQVEVVELFDYALGRLVPREAGDAVSEALAQRGVKWHFGAACEGVSRDGEILHVGLADGRTLEADAVLSAVGLRPRTALAEAAGLETDRGIVVDRHLRTSDPCIYALGDCKQVGQLVLPFIMPIMHAARALAKTLSGEPTRLHYPAMPVVVKTPAHPAVVSPPAPGSSGQWQVEHDSEGVRALYVDAAGKTLGFVLTGKHIVEKGALTKELPAILE